MGFKRENKKGRTKIKISKFDTAPPPANRYKVQGLTPSTIYWTPSQEYFWVWGWKELQKSLLIFLEVSNYNSWMCISSANDCPFQARIHKGPHSAIEASREIFNSSPTHVPVCVMGRTNTRSPLVGCSRNDDDGEAEKDPPHHSEPSWVYPDTDKPEIFKLCDRWYFSSLQETWKIKKGKKKHHKTCPPTLELDVWHFLSRG